MGVKKDSSGDNAASMTRKITAFLAFLTRGHQKSAVGSDKTLKTPQLWPTRPGSLLSYLAGKGEGVLLTGKSQL